MREFNDSEGRGWSADVTEQEGTDYKGRFYLTLTAEDGTVAHLTDVRWNSRRTAERTLETMSVTELRRRLRSAVGRVPMHPAS